MEDTNVPIIDTTPRPELPAYRYFAAALMGGKVEYVTAHSYDITTIGVLGFTRYELLDLGPEFAAQQELVPEEQRQARFQPVKKNTAHYAPGMWRNVKEIPEIPKTARGETIN